MNKDDGRSDNLHLSLNLNINIQHYHWPAVVSTLHEVGMSHGAEYIDK